MAKAKSTQQQTPVETTKPPGEVSTFRGHRAGDANTFWINDLRERLTKLEARVVELEIAARQNSEE